MPILDCKRCGTAINYEEDDLSSQQCPACGCNATSGWSMKAHRPPVQNNAARRIVELEKLVGCLVAVIVALVLVWFFFG